MDFVLNKKPKGKAEQQDDLLDEKKETKEEPEKIKKELEECRKRSDEYLNGWKRTQADFINYKKRQEESLEDWMIFCKTKIVNEMLPVLDTMETALKNKPLTPGNESKKWIEGMCKTAEQLAKVLKNEGLEEIKAEGEEFDPEIHEAVDVIPSEDKKDGTIAEVLQKGYKFQGKVIRTAKVRVVKNIDTNS